MPTRRGWRATTHGSARRHRPNRHGGAREPAAPAAAAASQAEARFGLIERAEPVQVKELTSRVVEVGQRAADRVVLTLENGQRWQTNEAADARYFRPGDLVTIEPAALGSFRARKEGRNRAFPVRRVD